MGDLTKNFNKKEFSCKCCGKFKSNPILVNKLQLLRDNINKPIVIYSAYRCPKHNAKVGGAKESQHMAGNAVDIHIDGVTYADIIWLANTLGFNAIGVYPDEKFVHLDVRPNKVAWVKYANKPYEYMTYEKLMDRKEIHVILG